MDNQIFALELNGLAGQAQALADAAKEGGNDAELLTRDLHDTQRAFQRLIESGGSICGFALEPHLPVIRDVSFHVAAARYSLSSRRKARHGLVKEVGVICASLDAVLKTFTGVAMVEPIFNAIVAVRQISVSAKEVVVLAREPRANGIASGACMVLPQKAGSRHARQQTPVVPDRSSSTPPKVLPQFSVEPTPRRR